ncbi:unnamed protein product, partial [Ilex paraguariensis]
ACEQDGTRLKMILQSVDGWFRPSIGLVMANCDGVFNIKLKKLAIGVVIRDHKERNEAIVVSDSHVLISLCTGEKAPPWEIAALVDDIKLISHSLRLRRWVLGEEGGYGIFNTHNGHEAVCLDIVYPTDANLD